MRPIALLLLLAVGPTAVQDAPPPVEPLDQHHWLQQLVGEWTVTMEMTMEPGGEPMTFESTESVRSIGDLWILSEGSADFGGAPYTSILTIGYDSRKETFVGTWIDTMQTHMWSYVGSLDEAGKVLTLEAEGPRYEDPSRTTRYRDAIEVKGPDHKVMTSSMRNDDGTWSTFMVSDFRRRG